MKHNHLSSALACALLGLAGPALAITTVEQNSSIPFSFSNPGARSLGMGGAFVGLADDATAAYTNPAGLTGLGLEQQVSVEVRRNEVRAEFASGGIATRDPFDTSRVRYGSAWDTGNDLSFLSWVLPQENWAVALYRHEMLNYENEYTADPVLIGDEFIVNPYGARTDLSVITYGVSFAYDIGDHLSLGAGLSWNDFEIDTSTQRYDNDLGGVGVADALVSVQTQRGEDDDIGYNLGLIFRGSDNFNIGLSYRSAPEFDYNARNVAGAGFLAFSFAPGVFTGQTLADQDVAFKAPDMLSVGFSWRPTDNLTVNFDVNRINYSNLSDDLVSPFLNGPDSPLTLVTQVPFVFNGTPIPAGTELSNLTTGGGERFAVGAIKVDDVTEPRLGFEYAMTQMARPVFLRWGVWREPQHTLRFTLDPDTVGSDVGLDDPENPRINALLNSIVFSTGDDEIHFSGGLGVAFDSFQIDFAADVSDRQNIFSLSGVWRF